MTIMKEKLGYRQQEKIDLAVRAAWMYYIGGSTQQDIALRLGISRQMAQRYVAFAVERGLVKVLIEHPVSACMTLAEELKKKYHLQLCRIIPGHNEDDAVLQRMIAVAGADIMERYFSFTEPMIINLGSGRTLKAAIANLPEMERPQHCMVSVIGAITRDGACSRYDVPLWAAEKVQGRYYILPVPFVADSLEDKQVWCEGRSYRMIAELAARAHVTFIGIGTIDIECPMCREGFLNQREVDELLAAGAVGELLGHPIDRNGSLFAHQISERVISLPLATKPQNPVIAFAGGERKRLAIRAALRGEWLTGLVTDEDTARWILQEVE